MPSYNDHWLQLKLLVEIGVSNTFRFVLRPSLQPHLLDQAQIKDLGIMRLLGSLICIRVKMVTGKVRTFTAKLKSLLPDTSVDIARLGHTKEGDRPAFVSTSLAHCFFSGNPKSFGDCSPELLILIGQIHAAIETIQSAGRSHLLVVHRILLSFTLMNQCFPIISILLPSSGACYHFIMSFLFRPGLLSRGEPPQKTYSIFGRGILYNGRSSQLSFPGRISLSRRHYNG